MTVSTATKELGRLQKVKQTLQKRKQKDDIDAAMAETDADIARQQQLIYDAKRDQALEDLAKLRGQEMAIVARYVEQLAGFESIEADADALRAEFYRVAGPFRKGDDVTLANSNVNILYGIAEHCHDLRMQGQGYKKYYDHRVASFKDYGR